ncbi:hypothetical protein Kpol_1037p59 [Vanderwaltozyma polyspora DSM 70294]|uniref:Mitochondrial chaperone TCM62 n=1 Tax=Vanderwaltozyma polyspora (strain ATCC 22028 / DSM 70294 / BCRC 21397 / CBS 2163 / NBRC 10782 / NRRL Y-8283 / UCD 57-17) TaxID=436907 RepID=A7TK00_VANPO|nr:uncharacterized protein Kpol_1037p59 [Vanderwaltozyma polyspora DSM 70294]EDO17462.1 hypothetical protein Kpol_1037p59 [Vanderwaltozyma polyspora DSM 70294]
MLRCHLRYNNIQNRTIKTLHTPVYKINNSEYRENLLSAIKQLDSILNSSSYNKQLLYQGKYKSFPQLINSNDSIKLQKIIRDYTDSLQLNEANNKLKQIDPASKLGKIGLQLFLDTYNGKVSPLATSLAISLMTQYNQYPHPETMKGINMAIRQVQEYIQGNKISANSKSEVDAIVDRLCADNKDSEIIKKILVSLDYQLKSDEIVRVVRGNKTFDEIEVTKGWKFSNGILNSNEAYLRSLEIPQKKLVYIDSKLLVLVYDGALKDANKILPSITYATKLKKPLLLITSGNCSGDALTSIIINNNKNKRQDNPSRTIVIRYDPKNNNGLRLEENHNLINFLKLPNSLGSIYSPNYSEYVPSKMCADQYYGELDSLKATVDEAFLHNEIAWEDGQECNQIQKTITLKIGAQSEIEIDQRISKIDNLINDIICQGLKSGFIPSYGISLAKCTSTLSELLKSSMNSYNKIGIESVLNILYSEMEKSLKSVYGMNSFEATKNVSNTSNDPSFTNAQLRIQEPIQDVTKLGIVEPWNKLNDCLNNTITFMNLLTSCNTIISRVFEKPKKN